MTCESIERILNFLPKKMKKPVDGSSIPAKLWAAFETAGADAESIVKIGEG
jgi:hypothetical protein